MNPNETVKKSQYDNRNYKNIVLSNEMQCLLISDLETDKSAACLNIQIGMAEDPLDLPGLAHFHEHMLFLGTKKFPSQNEFSSYLSKNSSEENNAETSLSNTEFFFDCSNEGLYGALDRFSQFFICPLFTESCTERELQAIHSEFEMTVSDDHWRSFQILKSLSDPGSLYNRFGCGCNETLKTEKLNKKLWEFNRKYYSSNLMKLCVYSNESLETIEKWIIELFSPVKNNSVAQRNANLYPKAFEVGKNMKKCLEIVPIKDKDVIELLFIVDENLHKYYKSKPEYFIGHLFGHEGTHSLLSLLKEEDLATALIHSLEHELDSFTIFTIRIELTKKGFEKYKDICEIVFCYLRKLLEKKFEDWKSLFEECSKIEEISFLFADKSKEIAYTTRLANNMQIYPVKNIIDGEFLLETLDYELIMKILKSFTVENLLIFLSSKNFQNNTNQIEKYFKTPFNIYDIPNDLIERMRNPKLDIIVCKKILDFPLKNIFVPLNFSLIPEEKIWPEPKKIYESEQSILWLKQGSTFKLPKIMLESKIYVDRSFFINDPKNIICAEIWTEILSHQINEVYYMAELAKTHSLIALESTGIKLEIKGFSDSALKYTLEALKNMFNISSESKEKFQTYYDKKILEYSNFFKSQPYKISKYLEFSLLTKNGIYFDPKVRLDTLKTLTYSDFDEFEKKWLSKIFLEWFINGSILEVEALKIVTDCEDYLKALGVKSLLKSETNECPSCKLNTKQYIYEYHASNYSHKEENNSSIQMFWQGNFSDPKETITMKIIDRILFDPCFDRLRTDQQLGYVVQSKDENIRGVSGFGILVMSCFYSSQFMAKKIEEFVKEMQDHIKNMEDDAFEEIIESILVEVTAKHNNIYEESDYFWEEIRTHEYLFNRKEVEEKILESIHLDDVLELFEKMFFQNPRKLEIHFISENRREENEQLKLVRLNNELNIEVIKTIDEWRKYAEYYPDYNALK